tara:strand:+ start:1345 stop:1674 length:330 start_codon:yes stop_codon:yes gene_type:complete
MKESRVIPSNYHLDEKQYAVMVSFDGKSTYSAWFNTEEEAESVKPLLEEAMDYHSYPPTLQEEGCYPERAIIMEEKYQKSGRDDPNHPMHGLFTGLNIKDGTVSNNNSE